MPIILRMPVPLISIMCGYFITRGNDSGNSSQNDGNNTGDGGVLRIISVGALCATTQLTVRGTLHTRVQVRT